MKITEKRRRILNQMCLEYSGFQESGRITEFWHRLLEEHDIFIPVFMCDIKERSKTGAECAYVSFRIGGEAGEECEDSILVYSCYKPPIGSKCDFLMYFS